MFQQSADGFVADKVFPVVPVQHQSNVYYTYDRGSFNRPQMKERAPGTRVERIGYTTSTATYNAKVFALGHSIDEQVRANADAMIDLDMNATILLNNQVLLQKEVAWSNAFFTSGVWTSQSTGVSSGPSGSQFLQWNNSSSTPITDVRSMKRSIVLASGNVGEPNKLVLGRQVYDTLLEHPDIVARVLYNQKAGDGDPAVVAKQTLASLFEVEEVLVMSAIQNSAVEGASESNAFIGGKTAMLAYVPKTVGLNTPAAGLNFSWTGLEGSNATGSRIVTYEWLPTRSTEVEIEIAYTYQKVSGDLGGFFISAIA
jgi:hypothetical protein